MGIENIIVTSVTSLEHQYRQTKTTKEEEKESKIWRVQWKNNRKRSHRKIQYNGDIRWRSSTLQYKWTMA